MADPKVRFKRSSVPGKIPNETQVPLGEIALNTYDGKVFASKNVGIGTTVFVVNPWSVGTGTDFYDTYFTNGSVGIGTITPTAKLDVVGDVRVSGATTFVGSVKLDSSLIDFYGSVGAAGSVLVSTGAGVSWSAISGSQGIQGIQGNDGNTGSQGIQGASGIGTQGIQGIQGIQGSQGLSFSRQETNFIATSGQTTFSVNYVIGYVDVYLNGARLNDDEYTATNGTSIILDVGANDQDNVDIISFESAGPQGIQGVQGVQGIQGPQGIQGIQGISVQGIQGIQGTQGFSFSRQETNFIATEGQTTFSVNYVVGYVDVYLNGIRLSDDEFTATNGTTIILNVGASGEDTVDVISFESAGPQGIQGLLGIQGAEGSFGGAAFDYTFDSSTANSDPGQGKLRLNQTGVTTANYLYIHSDDDNFVDITSFLQTIDDSTSNIKGHFTIAEKGNQANFSLFSIVGLHTEYTNYFAVPIAYTSGITTSFSNNLDIIITFARTGDKGDTGVQGVQGIQGVQGVQGTDGSNYNKSVIVYTATDGQTTFAATYTVGFVDVYLNGIRLSPSQYTASNGTSIILATGASLGDIVELIAYTGGVLGAQGSSGVNYDKSVTVYTATDSQTTFAVTYTVGFVDVYLNGIRLSPSQYTASNGTSVILTAGASLGDIVELVTYTGGTLGAQGSQGIQGTFGPQGTSGPSTTINATDDTTTTTLYPVMVSATGSDQTAKARSTATAFSFNSSSNFLNVANAYVSGSVGVGTTNPASALQVVGIVSATSYRGDGSQLTGVGGAAAVTVVTSNTTLAKGTAYMINSSGVVLTLPASPSTGDAIDILNNVSGIHTLARNGSTIMSLSEDMTFGEAGVKFKVWYTGSTWSLF